MNKHIANAFKGLARYSHYHENQKKFWDNCDDCLAERLLEELKK